MYSTADSLSGAQSCRAPEEAAMRTLAMLASICLVIACGRGDSNDNGDAGPRPIHTPTRTETPTPSPSTTPSVTPTEVLAILSGVYDTSVTRGGESFESTSGISAPPEGLVLLIDTPRAITNRRTER
jgi:hypothetical protein